MRSSTSREAAPASASTKPQAKYLSPLMLLALVAVVLLYQNQNVVSTYVSSGLPIVATKEALLIKNSVVVADSKNKSAIASIPIIQQPPPTIATNSHPTSAANTASPGHNLQEIINHKEHPHFLGKETTRPDTNSRTCTCTWSPTEQDDCKRLIGRRIKDSNKGLLPTMRRWLFFGDSTVAQFWHTSSLENIMVDLGATKLIHEASNCLDNKRSRVYSCQPKRIAQHCELNDPYGLPRPIVWESPNVALGEGPLILPNNSENNTNNHGGNATCLGCKNCQSSFVQCANTIAKAPITNPQLLHDDCVPSQQQLPLYGGYFAMTFARDVILQTPKYRTTQENILDYIDQHFGHAASREPSICVVRTGLHDMALPNMTLSIYAANVQRLLELLLTKECFHILWLQNTAPLWETAEDIPTGLPPHHCQTVERVRAYDQGGVASLQALSTSTDPRFRDSITTIDVFEASKEWEHADNIHLTSDWNRALGMFFVKLATKIGTG